jgi:hypothetical protein
VRTKIIILSLAFVLCTVVFSFTAQAETLSWNAVTTYTDGSSIGAVTVTYTAVWSTSSSLGSPTMLASSISGTSTIFNVTTAGMPRGSTIYFAAKATVGGVDSSLSTPLSWRVPSVSPSSPANLRLQ